LLLNPTYLLKYVLNCQHNFSFYSDGLRTGRSEFDSRQCKIILFSITSRLVLGPTQPPIQWVPGTPSPVVKRQGREVDHSHPSNAEVEIDGAIPPFPIGLHGIVLN
jgi:hypothetical protein